jgi:carbon monoxide dehydrogenase subunit G
MIHLDGSRTFPVPPAAAWAKLSDLAFVVGCLPDVKEVKDLKPDGAVLILRPGLSFVRGDLTLTITKLEETPPTAARWKLETKGIGSSSTVEATLGLAAGPDNGTALQWSADVTQLGGLLKAVPGGMIQGAARKVIDDVFGAIGAKL